MTRRKQIQTFKLRLTFSQEMELYWFSPEILDAIEFNFSDNAADSSPQNKKQTPSLDCPPQMSSSG